MVRTEQRPPAAEPRRHRPVVRSGQHQHVRLTRRVKWVLLVIAASFFTAGVVVPHALLIAAGLILAGSIGVGGSR